MAERLPNEVLLRKVGAFFDAFKDLVLALIAMWMEARSDQDGTVESKTIGADKTAPASSSNDEPLMTVEDLADYLKIKPQTIRDWVRRGGLPCLRINSEIRFRRSEIDKRFEPSPKRDTGIELGRSFLRPQNHRSKSNGI